VETRSARRSWKLWPNRGARSAPTRRCTCGPTQHWMEKVMRIVLSRYESPIGPLVLAADEDTLLTLEFPDRAKGLRARLKASNPGAEVEEGALSKPIAAALEAYFAGDTRALDRLE